MTANSSLLRKADLAIEDLRQNGGELNPEQGASFIRKLIKQPTILRQARVVEMLAPQRKINKIGFGKRILRKATSATALTPAQRSKPLTEQIELNTKEQIAEVRIPYDVMEDNIERATTANNEASNSGPGGLRQTIIDLIAERAALDLEELALLGDTAYVNAADADDQAYLSQLDGYLKRAGEKNVVNAGAGISKTMFKKIVQTMPSQYKRNKAALKHIISENNETEYRDITAVRVTGLGDAMLQGNGPIYAFGSPVESAALMPETDAIFTDPLNLIFGIQRAVSLEFDKSITERVYIIVLTTRVDYQVEETEAIVRTTGITEPV